MTTGPIEFLSDPGPAHEVPDTELGGADGIVQPEKAERLSGDPEASGGHTLEGVNREKVSDVARIMARRGLTPLSAREGWTGVADTEIVTDPVSGREVPESMNKAGGTKGELSDLKPA
jgi:hypothetical protein